MQCPALPDLKGKQVRILRDPVAVRVKCRTRHLTGRRGNRENGPKVGIPAAKCCAKMLRG